MALPPLAELAKGYGELYVPAFAIRLGDHDLVRDERLAVYQVEADLMLGQASRFSFSVADCFSLEHQQFESGTGRDPLDLLAFGTTLEICMGYGSSTALPTLMLGQVTEITLSFPEAGSPELVIAGYDHGYPLTLGSNSDSWTGQTDSQVVEKIASAHNLNAVIEHTTERRPQIEQNQQSDWNFLKKLADGNKDSAGNRFELYVDADAQKRPRLHFGRPRMDAAAVCQLGWRQGLLSFTPQGNIAGQVSKVEVYHRDPKSGRTIIGRASADDLGPAGKKGPGQYLKAFVRDPGKQPTLRLRQPVFTQSEADEKAKTALNELTHKFLTGDGESIGLPELRPDRTVQIDNLGTRFSRSYYIEQATHKVDTSGYRTRFKVRETTL